MIYAILIVPYYPLRNINRDKIIWQYSKDNPDSPYKWIQQKIADKMGLLHQTRVGQINEDFKRALKLKKSDEKSNKTNNLKKTKAEITEAEIKKIIGRKGFLLTTCIT